MKYLDKLKEITAEGERQIKELKQSNHKKEVEFTKQYFKVGSRVIYEDRDGYIKGAVIAVDDNLKVAVNTDEVNGDTTLGEDIELFDASTIDLD